MAPALHPQPLHRAVRTRADTTGALLRVLAAVGVLVAVLLIVGWPVGVRPESPPAIPAQPGPAPADDALVLPDAR